LILFLQWVCGVSPLDGLLVLLTVPKGENLAEKRPQLLIVEPLDEDFSEISTDLLSVRGFENYSPFEYHLEYLLEDKYYFVVSPKDVVVGKPRDEDDHIDWLLSHGAFADALESAELKSKLLRRHSLKKAGCFKSDLIFQKKHKMPRLLGWTSLFRSSYFGSSI